MKKRTVIIGVCVFLAVILGFSAITGNLAQDYEDAASQQLEDTIRRTAVACYGAEGAYPPNLAYMQQHYGLHCDTDRFVIHYDLFASNVMPEISVTKK